MSISAWFRSNLIPWQSIGPERVIRRFSPNLDVPVALQPDIPVKTTGVVEIDQGWRFATNMPRVFTLFRLDARSLGRGVLIYRAATRSRDAGTTAYLEMWCHVPGRGVFFAKGTHDAIRGYRRWRTSEIPFFLPASHNADTVTLNLTFDEPGAVEIRNVELVWRDVPSLLAPRHLPRTTLRLSLQTLRLVALTTINAALIVVQLMVLIVLEVLGAGFGRDDLFTWWPQEKRPQVGRFSG